MARDNFLQRYFDPGLEPPSAGSAEELEQGEVERIRRAMSVVLMASSIPRRLGGDVEDEDLALDKKRARRTAHALGKALSGWTKKIQPTPLDDEIRKEGAQLDWDKWAEVHLAKIENQLRCLATWAILNKQERWGKSAVVRLENERGWITYALRD